MNRVYTPRDGAQTGKEDRAGSTALTMFCTPHALHVGCGIQPGPRGSHGWQGVLCMLTTFCFLTGVVAPLGAKGHPVPHSWTCPAYGALRGKLKTCGQVRHHLTPPVVQTSRVC